MLKTISIEKALQTDSIFIDTRTPKEFEDTHIPHAINIPIFSNEERAVIGTIYKKISQEKAIEKGIAFFSKNLPRIYNALEPYKDKTIIM